MVKELDIAAVKDNLDAVLQFVEEQLEDTGCSPKTQMQIELAVEELFINIASYAYYPETGKATIHVEIPPEQQQISITFIDHGIPYNPLAKADPDVTLPFAQRKIGGLGIFLVKKNMDDMRYEYVHGSNVLTIIKKI